MNVIKSYIVTNAAASSGGGGGSGTVTSVGDLSPLFTTANQTTTPTFTAIAQNANLVYAGPSTGGAAAPTFRLLVPADIPDISATYYLTSNPAGYTSNVGTVTSVGLTLGTAGTDLGVSGSPITGSGSFTLDVPTASATNRGVLSNTDWTTFNNKQATGLSYLLASGGTATATNTFTFNSPNFCNIAGTWTSTVTGDFHINKGGSITVLAGGANTLNYETITATMIATANGQTLNGLVIDPNYSVGAFTGTQRNHLQLGNAIVGHTFQQSADNASRGLSIDGKATYAAYSFRFGTNSNNATTGSRNAVLITGTFNPSSGTAAFAAMQFNFSLNQSGGTGVLRGIYYDPSITAVITHTAIQTTSGRLAFNMTGNPSAQVQFRAAAASTASHILIEDSAQVQKVLILDNGDIRIGAAADYTRIRNSASGGNTKGLEFESLAGHLTYAFRFNVAGVSGSQVSGTQNGILTGSTVNNNAVSSGTYNEISITSDLDVTNAGSTQSFRHIRIDSNINCTAGTTTVRAFDYDPTVASATGLTHYGITIRPTGVFNGWGVASPVALMEIAGGTTAYAPLKLTSGTNLTTAQAGAFEYNGTNLFFTRTGTTREGVITQSAVTTEALVSDTSVTINIGGTTYKLLARA